MSARGRKGAAGEGLDRGGWVQGRRLAQPPLSRSFLLLSGPVTPFQSKASLTQQVEEGGKAKQLSHPAASPVLPWVAGFILLLSGCSNKSSKNQVGHGTNFLQRLWALTFTCTVWGPRSS